MNFDVVVANLEKRGFLTSQFATGAEAVAYLSEQITGKSVGIGGSVTVRDTGLADVLADKNDVSFRWAGGTDADAANAQVYILSANALAETGEIINIDGVGNRISASLFGHEKVYFVVGSNKITPDYDSAVYRARNVAAPLNAQRLNCKTPCAVKVDKCYDCSSPDRICNGMVTLWRPMRNMEMEVVLVEETLGF